MSESSRMRSAAPGVRLPHVWLVDPTGNPVKMQLARNINNGIVRVEEDGSVALLNKSKKLGWRDMRESCSPKEWAFWSAYDKACESGQRLKRPGKDKMPKCLVPALAPVGKTEFVFDSGEEEPEDTADDLLADLVEEPKSKPRGRKPAVVVE